MAIRPQAICLEDLEAKNEDERYLCCAVEVGKEPGLGIDNRGETRWLIDDDLAFHLFVTGDERIGLLRNAETAPVTIERAGRALEVPEAKPVILRKGDELRIAGRVYRVHLHGEIEQTYAPFFYSAAKFAMKAAAILAAGSVISAGSCDDEIQVLPEPPAVAPPPQEPTEPPGPPGTDAGEQKEPNETPDETEDSQEKDAPRRK